MLYGVRTGIPLALGLLAGVILALSVFPPEEFTAPLTHCPVVESPPMEKESSSEHWQVVIKKMPTTPVNSQAQAGKVVRARFAATELGIREKLVVIVLGQSSLSVALNASIARHVPRMVLFADASRVDADMAALPNLVSYRANGQHAHIPILNSIFNLTLHENYDWFYVMPDTTYVNPFELVRFVNSMNWNRRVAMGIRGEPPNVAKCSLQAGILLSNPAMQSLIQQRHQCNSIVTSADHDAFEMCIHHATNLSCVSEYQGVMYNWWKGDGSLGESGEGGGQAIHDTIQWWSASPLFNRSLSVSPLLSDADAHSLHDHFVRVELHRLDVDINRLAAEVESLGDGIFDGPTWPSGLPPYSKPPNRHQVPKWQFFTATEIFKNEPNQNVGPLIGDDKLDIDEVVNAARRYAEGPSGEARGETFVGLRNGYRLFDALRGMDYMLDLIYTNRVGDSFVHRVHVTRPISHTQLLNHVPYVKEDTDLTIVIPVGTMDEVEPARRLLARFARLCQASAGDTRQTRIVLALRSLTSNALRFINNDVVELRSRCKSSQTETMLLLLKADSHPLIGAAALDEAVDHFGQHMIYLLLSPHADILREFLDRVRINTIKHFQVYFPMPFVEYHPYVVTTNEEQQRTVKRGSDVAARSAASRDDPRPLSQKLRDGVLLKPSSHLVVHKDQGHFDRSDFSVCSLYGADFIRARGRLDDKSVLLDLSSVFLAQNDVHLMRAVEPSLRIRYHGHRCDPRLVDADFARCVASRREGVASKAQLANLLFSNNEIGSVERA